MNGWRSAPRGLEIALAITGLVWALAAKLVAVRAAAGIALRFRLGLEQPLLEGVFLLFLVVIGFQALEWVAMRGRGPQAAETRGALPLPSRSTVGGEWLSGLALGWGIALASVLPVLLSRHLHGQLNRGAGVPGLVLVGVLSLLVLTLTQEAIFRGYILERLSRAIGPSWAALLLSFLFAVALISPEPPRNMALALLNETLLGLLLAIAFLRTHGLWLGWGVHFGYRVISAVVLGLPVAGRSDFGALVDGYATGPRWLSGGGFGLDAALLTGAFVLAAIPLLYRISRDWAWTYTHSEIVPGGYEVEVAPPEAHTAMERSMASAPPPLVQILAPPPPPPVPGSREHDLQ